METHGELVFEVQGVFDVPAAQRLASALAEVSAGEQVYIDLTKVREFHDYGVIVLAQALSAFGARIDVRGLDRHQRRLLRYLGIRLADPDAGIEAELA
jgi:anti-anti-sigma regulatory factor